MNLALIGTMAKNPNNWARSWVFVAFWTALFTISAKILFTLPGPAGPLLWQFAFIGIATFFMPLEIVLLQFLAFFVFFEQTLWYIYNPGIETIYERELFNIKPVEFLIACTGLRLFFSNQIRIPVPRALFLISSAWFLTILLGFAVAFANGNRLYDMFIISEFRTLLLTIAAVFCFLAFLTRELSHVINLLLVLAAAKVIVTLASLITGLDILWPASAEGYVGHLAAFYGSDFNVRIATLALTFAALYLLFGTHQRNAYLTASIRIDNQSAVWHSAFPRWIYVVVLLLVMLAIFLSMRRGGIVGLLVVVGLVGWHMRLSHKLVLGALAATLLVAVVADAGSGWVFFPQQVQGLYGRILLEDSASQISTWGHLLDIYEGWQAALSSPIFGLGPGSRLELSRMAFYNLEPSLLVHQNLIHVWIKYGLIGVALYLVTFFMPIATALKNWQKISVFCGPLAGATMLGGAYFLISQLITEFFTPPFFQNVRSSLGVAFAIAAIYAPLVKSGKTALEHRTFSDLSNREV